MTEAIPLQLPPHSPEAEMAVLGCILDDPTAALDVCSERITDSEFFYDLRNRVVYESAQALAQEGKPVEIVSLVERLKSSGLGTLDASHLAGIIDKSGPSSSVGYYISVLSEKHALRRSLSIATETVAAIRSEATQDVGGFLSDLASQAADIADKFSAPGESSMLYKTAILQALDILETRFKSGGEISGMPTGIVSLDKMLSGLQRGQLIVIGARPSQGKTALGIGIADHVALSGPNRVLVFSLEMPADQLALRSLSTLASVDVRKVMSGIATQRDFTALASASARLSRTQTTIQDQPGLRVGQIMARARKIHRKTPLSLIVVDYLQLVEPDRKSDKRNEEVAEVSKGLKRLARELNVPVVALCQLNRDSVKDNRRPKMSDLRDSGAIEADADVIILIHQKPPTQPSDVWDAELIVEKQRNGPIGELKVKFHRVFTRFEDAPPESSDGRF